MRIKQQFLLLIIGLLISISGISQTTSKLDSTTLALAIDISSISQEITASKKLVSTIKDKPFYNEVIHKLDSNFRFNKIEIDSLYALIVDAELGEIEKPSLNAYILRWDIYEKEINVQYKKTNDLVQESTSKIEQLDANAAAWNATLEVLRESKSPIELRNSVLEIRNILNASRKDLQVFVSDLINLENDILELTTTIQEGNDLLLLGMEQQSQNTFVRNAPVLWKLHVSDSLTTEELETDTIESSIVDVAAKSFGNEKLNVSESFLETSLNTVYLHLILTLIALFFFLQLKKTDSEPFKGQDAFKSTAALIIKDNLIASTFFVSIIIALVRYSFIPTLVGTILVISLILLLTSILKNSLYSKLTRLALILAGLYIIGQFNPIIYLGEISSRYFLLLKSGVTLFILIYAVRNFRKKVDVSEMKGWKMLFKLAYFLYFILVISIIANVFGYVKLAITSTYIVIHVGVISYIFFGILLVGNGLITLAFKSVWKPKQESSFEYRNSVEKLAVFFLTASAIFLWLRAVLTTSGIYHTIADGIVDFYVTPYEIGSITISLAEIGSAIIVVIVTFSATKFIGIIINEGALSRFKFKRGVPNAISLVIRYTLIVLGLILALSVAGIDLSSLSIMAGALGIGIGFGLQNIISNFVSGLILVFERPLQEGDVVEVNNLLGVVNKIGVRSSNIRTYSGSEVVVPNESLISKQLINWTLSDQRKRIEINIGVEYGSNPREIIDILKNAASSYSEVLKDPAPQVYFNEFGESSLKFRLLFWVHQSVGMSSRSEVMLAISDALRENNITIPYPITTIKMHDSNLKDDYNTTKDQRSDANLE